MFVRFTSLFLYLIFFQGLDISTLKAADKIADLARGKSLAKQHCATCHLFPEPKLLNKSTWINQVLPRMAIRMGLSPASINRHPESEALWESGRFSKKPTILNIDFQAIVKYYECNAPEVPIDKKIR